jgi:hypothetical protein
VVKLKHFAASVIAAECGMLDTPQTSTECTLGFKKMQKTLDSIVQLTYRQN